MGIKEDREEFNTTGLRGLLRQVMKSKDEAFIRVLAGGWSRKATRDYLLRRKRDETS